MQIGWLGIARSFSPAFLILAAVGVTTPANSEPSSTSTVDVYVTDQWERPLQFAVAFLTLAEGKEIQYKTAVDVNEIGQLDEEFRPYVTLISRGASLIFSNDGRTAHHVYSFSDAKPLDVVVPSGSSSEAYVFEKSGAVSLGCNIHDHMAAFLYVAPSPYIGITNENGLVELNDVPPGTYLLWTWHPRLPRSAAKDTAIVVGDTDASFDVELKVRQKRRSGGAPSEKNKVTGNANTFSLPVAHFFSGLIASGSGRQLHHRGERHQETGIGNGHQ